MAAKRKVDVKDVVDLCIAILPIAVLLGIQYKDELKRAQMRVENHLGRGRDMEAEALKQVQREISWMEHGVNDAD